ncbi:hypothetical protein BT96DRAFT_982262 [Gymnopus androsaceus JB14]|uniref:CoA-dependent acyltransferase n=1 Tax=Gymnopus androsaceus JB14 TaxID=1447944 RepID=A0A6A4GGF9_9AGAR|nr:hypothetical protein BT96DRAFT_982262 [Gymnopus androsaceus JB14]
MTSASVVPTGASYTDTVILTANDVGNADSSMTTGYIVENPSFDLVASVHAAALRVVDKWTLLAGRVEVDAKSKRLQVRVPPSDGNHSFQPPVYFTTTSYRNSIDLDSYRLISQRDNQATTLVRPPVQYFQDPSTPVNLAEYVTRNAPILSIHISTLDNCICVGVTVPHGVLDAMGLGLVLKALHCELKGLEWTPPPLDASKVLDDVYEASIGAETGEDIPPGASVLQSMLARQLAMSNILFLIFTTIRQYLWPSRTPLRRTGTIYLGPDVVSAIVKCVNDSSPHTSKTVTTGDILWAWLLKAGNKRSTEDRDYFAVSTMSFRRTLAPLDPVLENYPQNLMLPSIFRVSAIASSSLHELALLHRRSIQENRTLAWLRTWAQFFSTGRNPSIVERLKRIIALSSISTAKKRQPVWFYTNFSAAGLDQLILDPTQLTIFFVYSASRSTTEFRVKTSTYTLRNGGTMFFIRHMDDQLWDAIEEELTALRNGKGPHATNEVGRRYY